MGRAVVKFPEDLANLFVMPPFVISHKRDGSHAVNVAQKRVLEHNVSKTIRAVGCAKRLESIPGTVKVFDGYILCRRIKRSHGPGRLHANETNGNYGSRYQPAKECDSLWWAAHSVFQIFEDARFDKTEMLNYFGDAPLVT